MIPSPVVHTAAGEHRLVVDQDSLFGRPAPAITRVVTDYGEVGAGASRAHYVLAENGTEYIIKGPAFVPEHPTVAGNEWVAANLARQLGLPLLDFQIVTMADDVFFASLWMDKGTFAAGIDAELFGRCANRDRIYDVVVLDSWLYNQDRHNENLVVRLPRRPGDPHLLIPNDHSHLLICPGNPRTPEGLLGVLDAGPSVSLQFVRESIVDEGRLDRALQAVEAVPEDTIRQIVRTTPESLLPPPYRDAYETFLVARQGRLRGVMEGRRATFPRLGG